MKEKKLNLKKGIKRPGFASTYTLILLVATALLAGHVLHNLWWTSRVGIGIPMLGYRMEDIPEIEESWLRAVEEFGGDQEYVDYVELFWNKGPVIYFNVRVIEGTSNSNARSAATDIMEHFIELSDETALDYNLQVVVSYGDIVAQRAESQEAVTAHVHEYNWSLTEAILAHAERYPSSANVTRAYDNINTFANSIILATSEEELGQMKVRHEAITVLTAEEEVARVEEDGPIPGYPGFRQVTPSELSQFPNWGTWNNGRSKIDWN